MNKNELIIHLNDYLKNNNYKDVSKNGLQVDNTIDKITKIGYAVDATSYIIDKAIKENIDMLIVHHGIYWGTEQTATGIFFERLKKLIDNNICLYACHLPLDANYKIGNNISIIKDIIKNLNIINYQIEDFGEYEDFTIGYGLRINNEIETNKLQHVLIKNLGLQNQLYNFGNKKHINSLCVVSGSSKMTINAKNNNYDLFITGELCHSEIALAKELKQSIFLGGHRETETFGVKLLAKYINKKYNIKITFLDEKY